MNRLTPVLLVVLRVAIGWYFLYAGVEKIRSHWTGPTEYETPAGKVTTRPWSSEGFFREAQGPLAPVFRGVLGGDADQVALKRLTPESVDREINDYVKRFTAFHGLDAEQQQKAEKIADEQKAKAKAWLATGEKEVKKTFVSGVVEEKQTTPQRIADYQAKLAQIREVYDRELPAFGKDVERTRLRDLKADATKMRNELLADLDAFETTLKADLGKLLTDAQLKKAAETPGLTREQAAAGTIPDPPKPVDRLNVVTMWFLTVVGVCLILGLFTRAASVGAALFLLMVYLSAPPLPYLPPPPPPQAREVFVSKELVMMLSALVLATTRSGYWCGLDGLLHALNPFRHRQPPVVEVRRRVAPVTVRG
jgi:uncharacterized membrane protein YphA (DoxX/SURF4 family)